MINRNDHFYHTSTGNQPQFTDLMFVSYDSNKIKKSHPMILKEKMPVTRKIDNVLQQNGEQMTVFVMGVTGYGKNSLSVSLSQQLRDKVLAGSELALIQLRSQNPAFQSTLSNTDVLSYSGANAAQQVTTQSFAKQSRGVYFVLDGWDELPSNICWLLVLHVLIQPELSCMNSLCKSAITKATTDDLHVEKRNDVHRVDMKLQESLQMFCTKDGMDVLFILDGLPSNNHINSTFRELINPPHQSATIAIIIHTSIVLDYLHPVVLLQIRLWMFTPKELIECFTDCLEEGLKTLLEEIKEISADSCYFPLSTSVHYFKSDNIAFPNAQHCIFNKPDLSCFICHLNECTCLLYTSPSPRDATLSRMPSSA